jgi:hypothetical protein
LEKTGKIGLVLAGCLAIAALPAMADTRFTVRQMGRNEGPPGRGVCDIRLQVDDNVEVIVDGDRVFIRTLSGQDARDEGSECNAPLPGREVDGFNFEVKERRGDIQLVEPPTRRNGGKVVVRIHDGSGGFGRYIFRLSWAMQGPPPERRPDGDDRRPPDRRDGDQVRGDLRIVSASWGARERSRDVTRLVQERMRDGRLRIRASNEEMGFDPAAGIPKTLVVVYEIRGRRQEARIAEGQALELP